MEQKALRVIKTKTAIHMHLMCFICPSLNPPNNGVGGINFHFSSNLYALRFVVNGKLHAVDKWTVAVSCHVIVVICNAKNKKTISAMKLFNNLQVLLMLKFAQSVRSSKPPVSKM